MNTQKISIALLTLALSSGIGVVAAHAQQGPPYGDHDDRRGDDRRGDYRSGPEQGSPGMRTGYQEGFEYGRRDFDKRHRYQPDKALHHAGRPHYREEFGPRDYFYRDYRDGFLRGYDRGFNGGNSNRHDDDDHHRDQNYQR